MMGLADTLRLRAARQGRTAEVLCGALGSVTVEALPPRELELLRRGADSARAIFYAACRELQAAGEALHRTGDIYTPDGILQFVSRQEAEAAARAVLALSDADETVGSGETAPQEEASPTAQAETADAAKAAYPQEGADAVLPPAGTALPAEAAAPGSGESLSAPWEAGVPFDRTPEASLQAADTSVGQANTAPVREDIRAEALLTAPVQEIPAPTRQEMPDADAAARRLLEGLRMASRARGG